MGSANVEIRQEIQAKGVKYWQVAEALGIRSDRFSVMLRQELTAERKQEVKKAIDKVVKDKKNG